MACTFFYHWVELVWTHINIHNHSCDVWMLFWDVNILTKPPQPTAWRSVPRRPSWWQTTPVASTERSKWVDRSLRQSQASNTWAQLNWWGFQAWDTLQDSTDNSSIDKAETSLDWQEYFSQLQDMTDPLPCYIHLPVCLWIMDPDSRAPNKNTSHGNEVLPQDTTPEGRPGMSDVSPLSGISGLSFDSTLLSPLLFFCLVLLPFLSYRFLPAGPFFSTFSRKFFNIFR